MFFSTLRTLRNLDFNSPAGFNMSTHIRLKNAALKYSDLCPLKKWLKIHSLCIDFSRYDVNKTLQGFDFCAVLFLLSRIHHQ